MTIFLLLLMLALLSISSASAYDADVAIDEDVLTYDDNLAVDENGLALNNADENGLALNNADENDLALNNADENGLTLNNADVAVDEDTSDYGNVDSSGGSKGESDIAAGENEDENLFDTDLVLVNSNVTYGGNLEVILSSNDNPLSNQNITFEVNGTNTTVTTDSNGKASWNILLVPDAYDISVCFLGNDEYASASRTFAINVLKITPVITVESTQVMNGYYLYIYLKDAEGNPLNGETITADIGGNNYTAKTSDGKAGILIKLNPKKYAVKLSYAGDSIHAPLSKSFNLNVLENQPSFKYSAKASTCTYYNIYLKDGAGKALSNKKVTIKIAGSKYSLTTDSNGRVRIYIKKLPGSYKVKLYYKGDAVCSAVSKSYALKIVKKASSFAIKNSTVVKGKYLYVYLNDASGNALKKKKLTIRLNGRKYVKTTNSNGRIALKINLKTGTYKVKLSYSGSKYYKSKSMSFKLKLVKSPIYKSVNGGIWLWNSLKDSVNFKTLKKYGIKNIFLSHVAVSSSNFKSWLAEANSYGFKVHIWMQVFYDKKWKNPITSSGSINKTLINGIVNEATTYAKIKGVSGVHLDYIRFPGTAYKYKNGENAVTEVVKQVSKSVKNVNSSLVVSCAVMGESLYSNSYYYGQNLTKMSKYVDVIVPMLYKGNYNQNSAWIKKQTAIYVKAVGSNARIWVGLQAYKSDSDLTRLSSSALNKDAANAVSGGANGIVLFRYGLTRFINMTRIAI